MDECTAFMSRAQNGRVKLECTYPDKNISRLWEPRKTFVLETTFDAEGRILLQKLLTPSEESIKDRIDESTIEFNIKKLGNTEFTEIKIKKACPKCGGDTLSRFAEAYASKNDVPVMPLYHCKACGAKSYCMTDEYLNYLIENNVNLFSENEASELAKDKAAFVAEMREYIIRMFASQKVMCIK